MRVMCIKQTAWITPISKKVVDGPVFGDMVTISGTYINKEGVVYYYLIEFKGEYKYESKAFIPIQEQETEVEEIKINKLENV